VVKRASVVPNEVLLLDARLQQGKTGTYPDISDDDYFLISSIDTLLMSRGLSSRQIEDGIVDGSDDGGIDAVYVFIDGHLVEDISDIAVADAPRIDLEIIQVKSESGFKEMVLQRLLDHLPLLLQLDSDDAEGVEFNPRVIERFDTFRATYLSAAGRLPELTIAVRYVTKAVEPPNDKVHAKVSRLKVKINEQFPNSSVVVELVGAPELNAKVRERKPVALSLRVSEGPISSEKGGLICLISLADYFEFITDRDDRLRDSIFEENVRDFEGLTLINRGIAESLKRGDGASADFWWLNNGVTIISRKVQPSGKRLDIVDPQIVNGLQTSRSIYQYFHNLRRQGGDALGASEGRVRQLLVRIIETQDDAVAAEVIKATNSQNKVSAANLRSAEPFQRAIEEHFRQKNLYYERKKNHYKNLGKRRSEIVEVLELAQAVGSVLLQQPNTARRMPSAFIREKLYSRVFSDKTPLDAYYHCLQIVRRVDEYLSTEGAVTGRHEKSNIRFHLARAAAAFALTSSRPRAAALARIDLSVLTDEFLAGVHEWVLVARAAAEKSAGTSDASILAKSAEWANEIDRRLSRYTDKVRWPKKLTNSRR
jgi:hypothetical protein